MPPAWLEIRKARPDVTDYLIHWTRRQSVDGEVLTALDILKRILACGFLRPSFAPKFRKTVGDEQNTIHGPNPAVCFTEQPLDAFSRSCRTLPSRYKPYALAVRKDRLYEYGGRPVIYGDEFQLEALPDKYKYLWARYNPIKNYELGGYPVDWTHEREWRATASLYSHTQYGTCPTDVVPLHLPPDFDEPELTLCVPWVLVQKKSQVDELSRWIAALPQYSGSNEVLRSYFRFLPDVPIISMEEVRENLKKRDQRWARIDTLPHQEVKPEASATFKRLGWSMTTPK